MKKVTRQTLHYCQQADIFLRNRLLVQAIAVFATAAVKVCGFDTGGCKIRYTWKIFCSSATTCLSNLSKVASSDMKIVVDVSPANYDTLLNKLSVVYALLKNGIVVHPSENTQDQIIQIACDVGEAEMLLYCAREFCPEAASQFEEAIKTPQPL
jgi:hypothetical protein